MSHARECLSSAYVKNLDLDGCFSALYCDFLFAGMYC